MSDPLEKIASGIGGKIKYLREKHKLSSSDITAITGISKELLEKIEKFDASVSVATLLKLANAFGVGVAYFFEDSPKNEEITVTRSGERVKMDRRSHHRHGEIRYLYEALGTKKSDKQMDPFLVEFPGIDINEMVFVTHKGEEFLYVLEGELEFRTAGRVEILKTGDSIYFESEIEHGFRGLGHKNARAVVVVYNCMDKRPGGIK